MFSFNTILILSTSLVIAYLISSTSGKSTRIKTLVENTRKFFNKVKRLDRSLNLPQSVRKFRKIKYRTFWGRSIRCNKKYIENFQEEFKKLAQYGIEAIDDFIFQIGNIMTQREMGKQSDRTKVCNYYSRKFLPSMKIKGSVGINLETQTHDYHFKKKLLDLYYAIFNIKPDDRKADMSCDFFFCFFEI